MLSPGPARTSPPSRFVEAEAVCDSKSSPCKRENSGVKLRPDRETEPRSHRALRGPRRFSPPSPRLPQAQPQRSGIAKCASDRPIPLDAADIAALQGDHPWVPGTPYEAQIDRPCSVERSTRQSCMVSRRRRDRRSDNADGHDPKASARHWDGSRGRWLAPRPNSFPPAERPGPGNPLALQHIG